jgi:protein NDRG1
LGAELVEVLNYFKLPQVTCFGEGAGANICARFAMQHPNRCLGVVLINPSGSTEGFFEKMADKV